MPIPWWLGTVVTVGKALWDIAAEAVGASQKKLDELGARVPVVLREGAVALEAARVAAEKEDALTAEASRAAHARVRAAGKGITLVTVAADEEPTRP